MNECSEIMLRNVCCTCLSVNRRLTQLFRIDNGVNKLFFLLSYDSEAYETLFQRAATYLYVCWECEALMRKLYKFQNQVCIAQKQLSNITDTNDLKLKNSLSKLSHYHRNTYNNEFIYNNEITYNFIDCGPETTCVKSENDIDNVPLEEIPIEINLINHTDNITEDATDIKNEEINIEIQPLSNKPKNEIPGRKDRLLRKRKKRLSKEDFDNDINYSTIEITEEEMLENRERLRLLDSYVQASSKCESCIEVFRDHNELEKHNLELHVQKPKFIQCDVCLVFIKYWWLPDHRKEHYTKYKCNLCEQFSTNMLDMLKHMKDTHGTKNVLSNVLQRVRRRAVQTNPVLKSRRMKKPEVKTPFGYFCYECNRYFENKYLRYQHILKVHREGFKCSTCGKKFALKNTLNKHEQIHAPPLPREKCDICDKMVRIDRVKVHAKIHTDRQPFDCVACDKRFVSQQSYEKHLRNSSSHAVHDVHKYKCTMCEKGFRTLTELNDHVNYTHMERTHHTCPICNKALATRRGVTRHVKRAHQGLKEKSGDKILCQTCGRAFRDKKCLLEHELIHTGEKPLSCDICGRPFRQSAALYTHKRRVHKMALKRQNITPIDDVNTLNIKE